jgi:hypothetical protein
VECSIYWLGSTIRRYFFTFGLLYSAQSITSRLSIQVGSITKHQYYWCIYFRLTYFLGLDGSKMLITLQYHLSKSSVQLNWFRKLDVLVLISATNCYINPTVLTFFLSEELPYCRLVFHFKSNKSTYRCPSITTNEDFSNVNDEYCGDLVDHCNDEAKNSLEIKVRSLIMLIQFHQGQLSLLSFKGHV